MCLLFDFFCILCFCKISLIINESRGLPVVVYFLKDQINSDQLKIT